MTSHCPILLMCYLPVLKSSQTAKPGQKSLSLSLSQSMISLKFINTSIIKLFCFCFLRYIEYNTRSLDCFKAYSSKIPRFLKNKPRMLVEQCVKRIPPNETNNKKDWLKCRELVKTIQSSLMNLCGLDLGNLVQQLQQVAYEMKNIESKDDDLPILKPPRQRQKLANSRSSKSGKTQFYKL